MDACDITLLCVDIDIRRLLSLGSKISHISFEMLQCYILHRMFAAYVTLYVGKSN